MGERKRERENREDSPGDQVPLRLVSPRDHCPRLLQHQIAAAPSSPRQAPRNQLPLLAMQQQQPPQVEEMSQSAMFVRPPPTQQQQEQMLQLSRSSMFGMQQMGFGFGGGGAAAAPSPRGKATAAATGGPSRVAATAQQKQKQPILAQLPPPPPPPQNQGFGGGSAAEEEEARARERAAVQIAHEDAWRACNPDFTTPFASVEDAISRLLPYHVFAEYEEDEIFVEDQAPAKNVSSAQEWEASLGAETAAMAEVFEKQVLTFNLALRNSAASRTEERLMLETRLLADEQRATDRLRALLRQQQQVTAFQHQQVTAFQNHQHQQVAAFQQPQPQPQLQQQQQMGMIARQMLDQGAAQALRKQQMAAALQQMLEERRQRLQNQMMMMGQQQQQGDLGVVTGGVSQSSPSAAMGVYGGGLDRELTGMWMPQSSSSLQQPEMASCWPPAAPAVQQQQPPAEDGQVMAVVPPPSAFLGEE